MYNENGKWKMENGKWKMESGNVSLPVWSGSLSFEEGWGEVGGQYKH